MPCGRPVPSARSFHSLIQEKRCRRRSFGWRIDVATVVDCRRSSAAFRRS